VPDLQEITVLKKSAPVLFISLIVILILGSSIACGQETAPLPQVEIISHNMTVQKFGQSPDSVAIISGTATNTGSSVIEKAVIEATFIDKNGNTIDTASATLDGLSPDTLWNFNMQTEGPNAWKIVDYVLTVK
jgi:hypothetical protein